MLKCISTPQARAKCVFAFRAGSGRRHFSCKFLYDVALVKCWSAFRLRRPQARKKCVSVFWADSGPRHFSCKFPYKVALVTCWNGCWLRRLAQSVCPRFGLVLDAGIFPIHFRVKWPLWHVGMHFDCAGSRKVCVRVLGSIWGAVFFLYVDVHFGYASVGPGPGIGFPP